MRIRENAGPRPTNRIDIASPDAQVRSRSVDEVLLAAEAAALLRLHYFVLHPGPEHSSDSPSNDRHDNRGNGDEHLPPGDGAIDWEKLMRELIAVRFRGTLILELAGQSDPAATMTNARRGRAYLREQARRLAVTDLLGAN